VLLVIDPVLTSSALVVETPLNAMPHSAMKSLELLPSNVRVNVPDDATPSLWYSHVDPPEIGNAVSDDPVAPRTMSREYVFPWLSLRDGVDELEENNPPPTTTRSPADGWVVTNEMFCAAVTPDAINSPVSDL
jgi:hypothetical protein